MVLLINFFTFMKLLRIIPLSIAALLLANCANRPESIAASYVSHERYSDLTCEQLSSTMANARDELRIASDKQDTAANMDAGGVFLILIPPSAFSGDHEAEVAKWKGTVQAIETMQIKKKCIADK